ncbi:hypothetical protein H2248_006981 [Termitomyces sp. 'cryptogamus']|nr:hypothetical protein H2248_006981 [Termitomyces sp. 'cryptogamus']
MTDAMVADKEYVPGLGTSGRIDTWRHWSRWRRGMFSGRWYFKLFNFLAGLAALAMACLGMWGAGKTIRMTFVRANATTSFGCNPPV